MLRYLFGLFLVLFTTQLFAQNVDENTVRVSGDYYFGESCGDNQNETEEYALQQMLTSISVRVTSDFKSINKVKESENNVDYERDVENVIQTYTTASLTNLQSFKEPRDCGIYVLFYINKEEVSSIFDNRKQLVKDIFDKASEYQSVSNYANALKYYHFANVLLNSIPVSRLEHNGASLEVEIPSRITDIIDGVRFELIEDEMVNEKRRTITLAVSVNGELATSLDYNYWDGNAQIFTKSQDGLSTVTLLGSSTQFKDLSVSIKYKYFENKDEIKEVGELWNLVNTASIPSRQTISLTKKKPQTPAIELSDIEDIDTKEITNEELLEHLPENLNNIVNYFNESELPETWNEDQFFSDKVAAIERLNNLDLSTKSARRNIDKTYDGWEYRQLNGTTFYPTINLSAKEYLIPDFDALGNLIDVNFGIIDGMYDEFKRASSFGNDWEKRQVIIKFVEKYRTAYLTRDISQLSTMFADEAVIIVGRVLQADPDDKSRYEIDPTGDQPDVEYLRLTKQNFISRQDQIFNSRRDIHLGFSTFEIRRKNNDDGVYGVTMRQHYNSDGYADEGHLFLLINFNNDKPKIYVRAWQPDEWNEDNLLGLSNFNINF